MDNYNGGEDDAHCQRCPQKCSWRDHKQSSCHYKIYKQHMHETTASQELSKLKDFLCLFKEVDNPSNVYSTNCVNYKYTCHDACNVAVLSDPSDRNMYDCLAMDDVGKDNAYCQCCPQKCSWRDHKWASYHYKYYIEQETTASQELLKFKDFPYFRQVDNPSNIYSLNCSNCMYTCHAECDAYMAEFELELDVHMYNCIAMDGGGKAAYCQCCPQRCFYKAHSWCSYQHKYYMLGQETIAFHELSKFKDSQFFFRQVDNPPNIMSLNCCRV